MDPILEEEKIRLQAAQAKQLLANPLFRQHSQNLEREIHESWESAGDPVLREHLWYEIQAMRKYTGELYSYIYTAEQKGEDT